VTDALAGPFDVAVAAIDRCDTVIAAVADRFEIGSVTKTMTATVVALLVGEDVLRLTDEIGDWLDAGPHSGITIGQLATHTSGLPSMAFRPADQADPWAGYTFERAEADLRRAPRGEPRYSNLGYQLLGLIVQRAAGKPYAAVLTERLLTPLAMTDTTVGDPLEWAQPLGAGGVVATIADLARYTRACLFPPPTPLGEAITLAQTRSLAWQTTDGVHEHSGGTAGFSACVGVARDRGRAIAILTNNPGSPANSARLKQVTRLTLAGEDPRQAGTPAPWPTWRAEAIETAKALVDVDLQRVCERLAPAMRSKITVERLANAWTPLTGPPGEITITRHEQAASGAVLVDITIGTRRVRMVVLPTGELGGLAFPTS
jgi:hypothetical protein